MTPELNLNLVNWKTYPDFHSRLGEAIGRYGWKNVADYLGFTVESLEYWVQELKWPSRAAIPGIFEQLKEIDEAELPEEPIARYGTLPEMGNQLIHFKTARQFEVVDIRGSEIILHCEDAEDYQQNEDVNLLWLRYKLAEPRPSPLQRFFKRFIFRGGDHN